MTNTTYNRRPHPRATAAQTHSLVTVNGTDYSAPNPELDAVLEGKCSVRLLLGCVLVHPTGEIVRRTARNEAIWAEALGVSA